MDTEKIKFSIRMDEELVRTADAYVQEGMALSRTEMIEDALRFYLGFLSAEKSEDYLLQSLSSMLGGTVKDSENRLARMDFKMAVELAKLCHVVAYSHEVDEGDLQKLHAKCVEEVSRINGTVLFEDAYRYQRGIKVYGKADFYIPLSAGCPCAADRTLCPLYRNTGRR